MAGEEPTHMVKMAFMKHNLFKHCLYLVILLLNATQRMLSDKISAFWKSLFLISSYLVISYKR